MKKKKAKAQAKKGKQIRQVAALPFRRRPEGGVEFLLVTSRETGRFIVPKGWPMKGRSDAKAAAEEAEQEAGVTGRIGGRPIGHYRYWKRLKDAFVPITVTVFALEVEAEAEEFRESTQRVRGWVEPDQAEFLIDEPDLGTLIREARKTLEGVRAEESGG
ncbi:NUDIX hydrolase [Mesorhizobium sp. L-8-10]|uniref:NUDIX hydrolase n=1 Tax=unclassified Mesorhizobium TaxID=325217 RepID=UPI00192565D0|nr:MULTISPECIES: NUDIX domain-containing protein [unclassified Mesorhizobium]BCH22450.1 NUDIX hydrolase [Mesorhizobium sp. L-8-3]BCH30264.1 NUDIX hydrolase [Mesorhizobium sp. L-8-10]